MVKRHNMPGAYFIKVGNVSFQMFDYSHILIIPRSPFM